MAYTPYPYRMALNTVIRDRIRTLTVPAVNAMVAAVAISADPARVIQYNSDRVIVGDLTSFDEPVICVIGGQSDDDYSKSNMDLIYFQTEIWAKTTWAMDNAPEDFEVWKSAMEDAMRATFNTLDGIVLRPVDGNGQNVLPQGQSFYNGRIRLIHPMPFPLVSAEKKVYGRGLRIVHQCTLNSALDRAIPLG